MKMQNYFETHRNLSFLYIILDRIIETVNLYTKTMYKSQQARRKKSKNI